jgi:flavin reductase (DIM6/NTAB) family NADH-FMN oxidoreductase RutF
MIEQQQFLGTLGMLPTGVTVISAEEDGKPYGMTANAVTSLSLNPPRIIACVARKARMAALLRAGSPFTVNILREDQTRLSNHFSGAARRPEVMPQITFVSWEGGPRLDDCLAAIGCTVLDILEGGDHWVVVGEVVSLYQGSGPQRPLIYYRSRYARLEPHSVLAPGRDDLTEGPAVMFYDPW